MTINDVKVSKSAMFAAIKEMASGSCELVIGENTVVVSAEDVAMFCDHEIEMIANKSAKAKETAARKRAEGDELLHIVEDALTDDWQTIGEITEAVATTVPDVSVGRTQYRVSELIRQGKAVKSSAKSETEKTEKGNPKTYTVYKLA